VREGEREGGNEGGRGRQRERQREMWGEGRTRDVSAGNAPGNAGSVRIALSDASSEVRDGKTAPFARTVGTPRSAQLLRVTTVTRVQPRTIEGNPAGRQQFFSKIV